MYRKRRKNFFRRPEFWVLLMLALVLGVGGWVIASRQTPDQSSDTPAPTASAPVTPGGSASLPSSGEAGESPDVAELRKAVYAFEEAYFSPLTATRTNRLRTLCTPEGLATLGTSTSGTSLADKAFKDMTVVVNQDADNIVKPEPLEPGPDVMSVSSKVWLISKRGDTAVNTYRVAHLSSWVKVKGVWKLAFFDANSVVYDYGTGA